MKNVEITRPAADGFTAFETGDAFRRNRWLRVKHSFRGLLYRSRYIRERRKHGIPLVVYQMGKVGSSSVVGILTANTTRPVFQVHHLSGHGLSHVLHFDAQRGRAPGAHYWNGLMLSRELARHQTSSPPLDAVTLMRDPVARNVSAFFQSLDRWIGREADANLTVEDLKTVFLEQYPHQLPLQWFDMELRNELAVDITRHSMNFRRGYSIVNAPRARVLFLRLEDLEEHGIEALQAFLGHPVVSAQRRNERAAQEHGGIYRRFLKAVQLPDAYLDMLYESPVTRAFYSDEELSRFRTRWSGPRSDNKK